MLFRSRDVGEGDGHVAGRDGRLRDVGLAAEPLLEQVDEGRDLLWVRVAQVEDLELRAELAERGPESTALSRTLAGNALLELFPDPEVGQTAMQLMIKRIYRMWNLLSIDTTQAGSLTKTEFEYQVADRTQGDVETPVRYGLLAVDTGMDSLASAFPSLLEGYKGSGPAPINAIHLALTTPIGAGAGAEEDAVAAAVAMLQANKEALEIGRAHV